MVTLTAPASVTQDGETYSFVKWTTHNHAERDFFGRTITVTLDTDIFDAIAWYEAENQPPVADFTWEPSSPQEGEMVHFTKE